jgi:glycerol-3-phosphate dehydrogenase (NAD(P)+)
MSRTIAILGGGGWGTALALLLHGNGHRVRVWGPFEDEIAAVRRDRVNALYLPDVPLPADLVWTADPAEAAAGADLAVAAVPTHYFRAALAPFARMLPEGCPVLSVSKGFDPKTRARMSVVAAETLGPRPVAALSGPSHAAEVARRQPTAIVIAAADHGLAKALQALFMNPFFRVYTSDDITGVELGGGLKNVMAIAVGACDGLGFGDNTRAALITRGLAEMTRLGVALGARPDTFAGLSGVGDLIVTCTSRWSRNRQVGLRLGQGESIAAIRAGMKQVAEGVWNCTLVRDLADQVGVRAPITEQVCALIHENLDPRQAVRSLMERDARPERDG